MHRDYLGLYMGRLGSCMNPPNTKNKKLIKINAISQAQLIKFLWDGNYSCVELAEMTGLHYVTVLQYTRELHSAGAAHINSWEKDARGRDVIKIYKLGPGKDKARHRKPATERSAAYRAKKRMREMTQALAGVMT